MIRLIAALGTAFLAVLRADPAVALVERRDAAAAAPAFADTDAIWRPTAPGQRIGTVDTAALVAVTTPQASSASS